MNLSKSFFRWGGGWGPSHPSLLSMVEQIDFHLAVAFASPGLSPDLGLDYRPCLYFVVLAAEWPVT